MIDTSRFGRGPASWLTLISLVLIVGACHEEPGIPVATPKPTPSPPPVLTALPRAVPTGWIGVVVPRASVDLSAPRAGKLEAVDVRPGDTVVAGQRLARFDIRGLDQEVRMAEAEVAVAHAEHQRAIAEADREQQRYQRRLAAAEVVSREEQQAAGADARAATAMRDAARAQLQQRQVRLEDFRQRRTETVLRAPFDGRIAARYLDAGAMVSEGAPVLRLVRDGALTVRFAVPPSEIDELETGMTVHVRDADRQTLAHATVVQIAPELDIPSQMVFAEALPTVGTIDAPHQGRNGLGTRDQEGTRDQGTHGRGSSGAVALRAGGGVWVVPAQRAAAQTAGTNGAGE